MTVFGTTTSNPNVEVPGYDATLVNYLNKHGVTAPVNSDERIALESLWYQGGANLVGGLTIAALQQSDPARSRADLWYDIRYNNNPVKNVQAGIDKGIATRMYLNSAMLDLYGSDAEANEAGTPQLVGASKSLADDDAASIYQMYTMHRDGIIKYDLTYAAQLTAANNDVQSQQQLDLFVPTWTQSFSPAYTYLLSLFSGKAQGVTEGNIWAAPDDTSMPVPWTAPLDNGDVMVIGGLGDYTGTLWTDTSNQSAEGLFLVSNSGTNPSGGYDTLSALGKIEASAWSDPYFTQGLFQVTLSNGSTLIANMSTGQTALGSNPSTLSQEVTGEQEPSFSFGGNLRLSAINGQFWNLSVQSNNTSEFKFTSDPEVTLFKTTSDVVLGSTGQEDALSLAPNADALLIGSASGYSTVDDAANVDETVLLALGDGNTLRGNEGDTLVAAGNNETFEVVSSAAVSTVSLEGEGGSSSIPVTTFIGGAIDAAASTGDTFDITARNTIAIGSSGTNTFNIGGGDFDQHDSNPRVDVIWGGSGVSTYNFSSYNNLLIVDIPNLTTSELAAVPQAEWDALALNYQSDGPFSYTAGGPTTIIVDPGSKDVYELDGVVIQGGALAYVASDGDFGAPQDVTNVYATQSGFRLEYSQDGQTDDGDSAVNLVVDDGIGDVEFDNFQNGMGGMNFQGAGSANTIPDLAIGAATGDVLTASSSVDTLTGGGFDVDYDVGSDLTSTNGFPAPPVTTIYNQHASTSSTPLGTLAFGDGVGPSEIRPTALPASGQDLAFVDTATGQVVDVADGLDPSSGGLAEVTFADGTAWTYADVLAMLESPTGAEAVTGSIAGDTTANVLDSQGLVGTDIGNGGGDTFIFNSGYGQLTIEEQDPNASDVNILQLGTGISPSQAVLSSDETNVYLSLGGSDKVTLEDMALGGGNGVERITFANGTVWSESEIASMLATGTPGNDQLYGIEPGLTFDGKGGSDFEQGQGGGDTFNFNSGYGQLEINEHDTGSDPDNTLALGVGIDPSQVTLASAAGNVYLSDGIAGDTVTLENMALGGGDGVERISFANGTVWNETEIASMLATGTTGNDQLYGIEPGETFDGKGGSDYEQGRGGGDTFIFDPGYGQLTISEDDTSPNPENKLEFGAGIDPSQIAVSESFFGLTITDGVPGDSISFAGGLQSPQDGVQEFVFANGTVWDRMDLFNQITTGTTGSDRLNGIVQGQTFDGKGGSDYEQGLGGGDTFIFDPGYGQLEINERDYTSDSDNTLALGAGIDPSQVTLTATANAVFLSDGIAGDEVTLDGMTMSASAGVQQITFADGTTWNRAEIASMLTTGTTGDDQLYGLAPGQTFDGKGGSDYEQGLGGGDTFIFDPGYGALEIKEQDSSANPDNTLALGAGIDPSQVTLTATASAVFLTDGISGDEVMLDDMTGSTADGVQQITFADGTTWDHSKIASMLATGTTGNDQLYGITPGQTFDGKGGSDYEQGLGDGDTFVFDPGYGQLEINEQDTNTNPHNALAFGAGIDPSQVTVTEMAGSVYLSDGIAGDQITLDGMTQSAADGVQQITFADGTTWSRADLASMLTTGTTGDDQLYGIAPGQTFDGKGGSDYEQGLGGGNTFIFQPGYGQLTISETDTSTNPDNKIDFGAGIDPSQITVSEGPTGLTISDGISGDLVTILGNPANAQAGVQEVDFAEGTSWTRMDLLNQLTTGTSGNDSLSGVVEGQTFDGKGGSDYEQGLGGGDTFIFNVGYGQLEIGELDSTSDPDNTLALGVGIDPSQVVLTATTTNVYLTDGIAGDEVTLAEMGLGASYYGVQNISFADGTTWNRAEIASMLATGTTGNDQLYGIASGLTFDGKGGSDYEQGLGGGDTFIFDPGYGQLEIAEQDVGTNPDNTLALGAGIDPSQVTLTADATNVYLSDGIAGDEVTLDAMSRTTSGGVQQITFANGTMWSRAEIASMLATGTTGNDQLHGVTPGLTFDGKGGSDYEQGLGGGDTFIFNPGYGQLEINEKDGSANPDNTLALGAGIDPSQVALTATADAVYLTDGIAGDEVTLDGMTTDTDDGVQQVTFANGTVWSRAEMASMLTTGTTGNDQLYGIVSGLTFDGKGGSDYEQSEGSGNTFIFNPGYGQLEINQQDESPYQSNILSLGAGLAQGDITLQANDSTGNLTILDGITGDSIVIDNDLYNQWGVNSRIPDITFSDGSTLSLSQPLTFTWSGSTSTTSLTGSGYGANLFNLAPGGDNVTFGNGSGGGSNSNLVNYAADDGVVTINTNGGSGSIAMAAGITQSDITLQADDSTGNLTILDGITGDSIVVDNDLSNNWGVQSALGEITFSDGSTLDLTQPLTFTWSGTASEINLTGSGYGANVFNLAPGGDSVTFGNGSGGGSNSNLVSFASGDGAVTINTNGGTGSIAMAAGINQGDLALQSDSAGDLTVFVGSTGDSLTIASNLSGGQSMISQISFSDGTVVTGSQLVDLASLSTSYQAAAGEAPDLPTLSLMDTAYLSGTSVSQIDTAISSEFSGAGPSTLTVSPVVDEQPVALGNTLLPFATTTLADSNSQQVDIATVTLSSGAGSLSNLGSGVLTNSGLTYTASGSTASVQADLQGLTLTPAAGAAGSSSSLGLTISNLSGGSVSASVDVPIQAAGSTSGLAFIYGSADNNALTATASPDQFAFANLNMGAASISGFDPSADVLQLSRSQFADFSALQNSLSDTSGGAMISIDPNNSILLKNVTVASLHASDFQFA